MKTEEQAAQALEADPELKALLTPAGGQKASRWAFKAGNADFESDVAFRVKSTGTWLFTEPDDAARAPQNVTKYLMWIEKNAIADRIHLIHPIGPQNDGTWHLACFLGSRIETLHTTFTYHPYRVQDWHNDKWIAHLVNVVKEIVKTDAANRLEATGETPAPQS